MLVVTETIVDRIVQTEVNNLVLRLGPYRAREGNPMGVYFERFGDATAFLATEIPVRFFNSVLATSLGTVDHLDAIEAFYGEHGRKPIFEIAPGRFDEAFALELHRRGYRMVEFHTGLARSITPDDAARDPQGVREVDGQDAEAFERWLDVYLEGWNGAGDHEGAKVNMRAWPKNPGWRFYLADADGEPAGAALLDLQGATAMMGSASTVEKFRGRGLQQRLVSHRIGEAARAGCDLVVGGSYFTNPSMRNQQRAGLYTAFTRGVWLW